MEGGGPCAVVLDFDDSDAAAFAAAWCATPPDEESLDSDGEDPDADEESRNCDAYEAWKPENSHKGTVKGGPGTGAKKSPKELEAEKAKWWEKYQQHSRWKTQPEGWSDITPPTEARKTSLSPWALKHLGDTPKPKEFFALFFTPKMRTEQRERSA